RIVGRHEDGFGAAARSAPVNLQRVFVGGGQQNGEAGPARIARAAGPLDVTAALFDQGAENPQIQSVAVVQGGYVAVGFEQVRLHGRSDRGVTIGHRQLHVVAGIDVLCPDVASSDDDVPRGNRDDATIPHRLPYAQRQVVEELLERLGVDANRPRVGGEP